MLRNVYKTCQRSKLHIIFFENVKLRYRTVRNSIGCGVRKIKTITCYLILQGGGRNCNRKIAPTKSKVNQSWSDKNYPYKNNMIFFSILFSFSCHHLHNKSIHHKIINHASLMNTDLRLYSAIGIGSEMINFLKSYLIELSIIKCICRTNVLTNNINCRVQFCRRGPASSCCGCRGPAWCTRTPWRGRRAGRTNTGSAQHIIRHQKSGYESKRYQPNIIRNQGLS